MPIKHTFAVAAITALLAPTFSFAQNTISKEECEEQGGTVDSEDGTCVGVVLNDAGAAGLGTGLGTGVYAAGALVIGAALASSGGGGSSSSTTTTTTTTSP